MVRADVCTGWREPRPSWQRQRWRRACPRAAGRRRRHRRRRRTWRDDGAHAKVDDLWGPEDCDGVADPVEYDYLGCQSPVPAPDGPSAKDWPVIYPAGNSLTIKKVVFVSNGPVTDPQLTANAVIRGLGAGTFTFPELASTAMTVRKVGDQYQLTATNLTFTGDNLPAVVGRDLLSIAWTITEPKTQATIAAGDEHFTVYVTAGTYTPASGRGASQVAEPYESLLDVGSVAATGKSGELAVFNAIWKTFASRKIAGVLAFQGISAEAIGLGDPVNGFYPGFYAGPDPAKGRGPGPYAYMLVGPGLWKFSKKKNAPTNYPYRDNLTVGPHNRIMISGSGVSYQSTRPIAQGRSPIRP